MTIPAWRPSEIIINNLVKDDPITLHILSECRGVPVKYIPDSKSETIKEASDILRAASGGNVLAQINAGKSVIHIAPASNMVIGAFKIEDKRMMCPEFDKLTTLSNGCFYKCDWCFLKGTYRAQQNFITIRVEYDKIKTMLLKRLKSATGPVLFDTGELADSLALEHLTKAGSTFIPWFAEQPNGYMYMLTKSANIDGLLKLKHNNHTFIAWSINTPLVSSQFEVGAASFSARIAAAIKAQEAGYPIRLRLDPIIPIQNWKKLYAATIKDIFKILKPERITLGTLRLEDGFYKNRDNYLQTAVVKNLVDTMVPLLDKDASGSIGKYSFPQEQRLELFIHAITEIRKYSDCDIALCKETKDLWDKVGLDLKECKCVCQYDSADMTKPRPEVIKVANKKTTKAKTKTEVKEETPVIGFVDKPEAPIDYKPKEMYHIKICNLNPDPFQPRKSIDPADLKELSSSIERQGVLQPILFREDEDGNLIIIAGERRFQASKQLNKETIPAIYIDSNSSEIALVENLLRVDLTPIEEAEGLQRLKVEKDYTNKALGAVFGKAESTISEILKINQIPQKLREKHRSDKQLSKRGLLEVAKGADEKEMSKLFNKLVKNELNRDKERTQRNTTTRGPDVTCRTMGSSLLKILPELDLNAVEGEKLVEVTKVLTETLQSLAAKLGYTMTKS